MSSNNIAIVTGANKGLGFSTVKLLCERYDGKVYLTSRDESRGQKAINDLKNLGLNPIFHQLDIADKNSVEKFIKTIRNNNEIVDILINNAGILMKDATESKIEKAELILHVNLFSLVDFTESILPFVKEGGSIVNISSSSGHLSRIPSEELRKKFKAEDLILNELKELMNSYLEDVKKGIEEEDWGGSSYVVSKVGVNCYTFMLHRRLHEKGIKVNCIHPGYVMSDMTHGTGSVTPEAAAELPVHLALRPTSSGTFVWHDGKEVPWDGSDPRVWIDGKK